MSQPSETDTLTLVGLDDIRPTPDSTHPRVAGRYTVQRCIARGGAASVWRAIDLSANAPVALKVMHTRSREHDVDARARFRREADALARMNHPHVVRFHEAGTTDDGRPYIALELIEGRRLSDELRGGAVTVDTALRWFIPLCSAVAHVHDAGFIHRDLKPANVLLTPSVFGSCHLRLVDFGVVKVRASQGLSETSGLIIGSPHCMAPEQVRGEAVCPATDIYALGVILHRMLAGAYPFSGATAATTMLAHISRPTPRPDELVDRYDMPPGLARIISRCLAKPTADRFQRVDHLLAALQAARTRRPPTGVT